MELFEKFLLFPSLAAVAICTAAVISPQPVLASDRGFAAIPGQEWQHASVAEIAAAFKTPPHEARPRAWWHWMDNNITREGITKDLEAMAAAGLGGATILDIACFRNAKGPVKSLSPEWYEMVNWAGREADRLGLSLSFHNCPGWSSSGGPWIRPEDAMKRLDWTETVIDGGASVRVRLPECRKPTGFARDVAVVAFPSIPGDRFDRAAYAAIATNAHFDASLKTPPPGKGYKWVVGTQGAKEEQWLDYSFRDEVAIGRVEIYFGSAFGQYELNNQVVCEFRISDDGENYRSWYVSDSTQKEDPTVFSFPEAKTRHVRIVFRRVGRANTGWAAIRDVRFAPGARVPHASRKTYRTFKRNAFADIPYVPTNRQPCQVAFAVDPKKVAVISDRLSADGTLEWTPPTDGPWTVLRFMMVAIDRTNHPVNPEARGLECDKLSRKGVDAALNGMLTRIMDDAVRSGVKAFKYTLVDSYEVGAMNWTDGMDKLFKARRGYAIEPFLPAMTGRYVGDAEMTERFLQDFRWLVSTLYSENYGDYFAAVCHARGLEFENEPYCGPFDEMRQARSVDIPMGEFWHGSPQNLGTARLAGNIGDVYARRYVQTETFTAGDKSAWMSYPEDHKIQGDAAFCEGVNRFVFHSYAHQPFDTPGPGVTMGPWGFHFNRHNTLWDFYPGWLGYLGRSQFLLQQGRSVADVLYVTRENVPVTADWRPELPFGYKGNCCDAGLFMESAKVDNGRVVLPSGMSYRLLVLPQTGEVSPAFLRKALALAEAGADVWLGGRPARVFGLGGYPDSDREVARLSSRLWDGLGGSVVSKTIGKGRVWHDVAPSLVLKRLGVQPDFAIENGSSADIRFIHRALKDGDVYFVANIAPTGSSARDMVARFRATGEVELWNADDASRRTVPECRTAGDGITEVGLNL
ncbi:MAG: glycosyl hydrolase, partial [Kiritimatiellia bacterium]